MKIAKRLMVRVICLVFAAVGFAAATSQEQGANLQSKSEQDQRVYRRSVYILPTLIAQ
jgi:YbbR domain-containing protein